MSPAEAATQVRFAQLPAGVPDDDTWRSARRAPPGRPRP
jgi:hypothetical protein